MANGLQKQMSELLASSLVVLGAVHFMAFCSLTESRDLAL